MLEPCLLQPCFHVAGHPVMGRERRGQGLSSVRLPNLYYTTNICIYIYIYINLYLYYTTLHDTTLHYTNLY